MSKCKFDGIGRLGADAETSTTKNGTAVLSWRMACDRGYGENKQAEWVKVDGLIISDYTTYNKTNTLEWVRDIKE